MKLDVMLKQGVKPEQVEQHLTKAAAVASAVVRHQPKGKKNVSAKLLKVYKNLGYGTLRIEDGFEQLVTQRLLRLANVESVAKSVEEASPLDLVKPIRRDRSRPPLSSTTKDGSGDAS